MLPKFVSSLFLKFFAVGMHTSMDESNSNRSLSVYQTQVFYLSFFQLYQKKCSAKELKIAGIWSIFTQDGDHVLNIDHFLVSKACWCIASKSFD